LRVQVGLTVGLISSSEPSRSETPSGSDIPAAGSARAAQVQRLSWMRGRQRLAAVSWQQAACSDASGNRGLQPSKSKVGSKVAQLLKLGAR
jgi:hypothetical protein